MRPFHPLPARPTTSSAPVSLPAPPTHAGQNRPANRGGRGRGRGSGAGGGQPHSQHFHSGGRAAQAQEGRGYGGAEDQGRAPRRQHHTQPSSSSSSAPAQTTTDGPPDATIQGLNIRLDHPLLIEHWIAERKKRWPTKAVIEQKERDAIWRLPGSSSAEGSRKRKRNDEAVAQEDRGKGKERATLKTKARDGEDDSSSASSSSEDDDDSSSSESAAGDGEGEEDQVEEHGDEEAKEDDGATEAREDQSDAVDKNVKPESSPAKAAQIDKTVPRETSLKENPTTSSSYNPSSRPATQYHQREPPRKVRPKPRGPPSNPFARPSSSLLHALLRRETASHTNAVLQFFRFLVLNAFLVGVERKRGDAEEALRRANLIVDVAPSADEEQGKTSALPQPRRIELKPLSSLAYPPAPDPLTFLDPLRSLDPFPLTHEQLLACCEDEPIREILGPCTLPKASLEAGTRENGLTTAIRTLDELPTESHRTAALELILHVVADNPSTPHHHNHLGAVWQPPPTSLSKNQMRPISETELFRLGLRVGFSEQDDIRRIAERVSVVLEQVPVHVALPDDLRKAVGLDVDSEGEPKDSTAAKAVPAAMGAGIYEARGVGWQQLEWEREWERRETLKRLGIRLD
ncbi:unnamed protein product [Tilletia controversa]|uniref:FMR1-interacting protein 1 conserved domain-containing protein n=3 Tax=Tilletia TaxID=13289 RepID=A0A8X7T081_9BASI|nr:hypothetical protein CF336_g4750 [Tilletia laevis]KAE8203361.1 hypothetical protein CF328_g1700 [Tilletia controversa]KAE8264660.1 hypothetical protein A4X03_0g793 [Tilletia caries]KAE8207208.1 hypothetical protein CF335_g1311 [Tilletia laevis]KAE8254272.1 hypothetical protein A4X06_0g977 [Tilletia controversa]